MAINIPEIIKGLRQIQTALQNIVDDAAMDSDTCFHEKPDYIISTEDIQMLNKIIGRGD